MLERTSKIHFDDILESNIVLNQDSNFDITDKRKIVRKRACNTNSTTTKPDEVVHVLDDHIMTRKTRTRTPRIPTIQSGYCAVCNVPYNSVEDHIQSKKHQKLIGEDANYIALNGSLNGFLHTNSIPFLNLNGVDAIGVHETSLEDFSPPQKKRNNMRRTRAISVMSDRNTIKKLTPLSPTNCDKAGHCLRSRRNINYMTPPLDDDSLLETPEIAATHDNVIPQQLELPPAIPPQHDYKEYRELRSSTRALAKLTEPEPELQEEVWNSGRPKRACIRQKRTSLDERLSSSNFKTFYKVEVLTTKARSNKDTDLSKRHQSQSPKREGDDSKDKGLIVKFKKLRNAELTRLNNEATNFLFPKRDDTTSDGEDEETDVDINSTSGTIEDNNTLSNSNSCNNYTEINNKKSKKYVEEDDASMDSNCSNKKKRRRTHAEAFIRDNQKYYKFETPGSSCCRLRYHGSYLAPLQKSPKHNGDNSNCKLELSIKKEEEPPDDDDDNSSNEIPKKNSKSTFDRSKYKFSFENVHVNSYHYAAFMRQDRGQQKYFNFTDDAYWGDSFLLPYQMPFIKPLDPKRCINRYKEALKALREKIHVPESEDNSSCATPDINVTPSTSPSTFALEQDDDSKMSGLTQSSACSTIEGDEERVVKKRKNRRSKAELQATIVGKNPRKSPRQHASTLAILSSFLQQRKRRSRNKNGDEEANQSLATIPEEEQSLKQEAPVVQKPKRGRKFKVLVKSPKVEIPKVDYVALARQIDDELDTVLDGNIEEYDIDIDEENTIDFHNTKPNLQDIMILYDESKAKENVNKSCRRFLSGCPPGRKPGRKKKKNKTGWPNKSRKLVKRATSQEKEEENDASSTIDSVSVNNDSDDEIICDEDVINNVTDCSSTSIINKHSESNKSDHQDDGGEEEEEENCDVDRVDNKNDKILTNKVTNNGEIQLQLQQQQQPFVIVEKLRQNTIVVAKKNNIITKRTKRSRSRFVVPAPPTTTSGSPKSPRALRKPRGRWYKER